MSQSGTALQDCPEIQDRLNNYFTECDKSQMMRMHETSFVQFLRSPVNTKGALQQQLSFGSEQGSKQRIVELVYPQRFVNSDYSDVTAKVCESTRKPARCKKTYTIPTIGTQYDEVWDLVDLSKICQSNPDFIAEQMMLIMNGAIRKMDADLVADLVTLIGNFGDGETNVNVNNEKVVQTLQAGGIIPDSNFIVEVEFAGDNAGYCSIPYVFGWGETKKAFRRLQAGCCANSGLDLSRISGEGTVAFLQNSNIEQTFGVNHFMSLEAGSIQLITWNEFVGLEGINVFNDSSYKQGTLVHPETGIMFDFLRVVNCGKITFSIKLDHKLVGMPDDMFKIGDRHEAVTGVNEFLITNP